ncbi:hypothetical protein A3H16_01295 [Candidatus Kaiserbacteria bacterium RIFCSPLOWO2_12_FULL_53_8]|uniref:ACT domain-containing protein n=2 Tax=Candidatus Kaiseribacteriota TaxID=1752734 RepID=A0A1F6CVH3_9BACT|nr:MAG: hypothetical protein A2851_03715 [Candidatus Kaiserbacteria bacterium RIFCSPHIGHO2_01_FULL_53_29]OGG92333.1 MAG: hypothetical protein A3H16_01295 [Candidatus Kaiserbacteria bacterium RIFCSPLOWO2_12_FULL_53_8]
MRTISQVVEEVIQRSPFLAETIAEGIANNAQIARRIKPDVEKRLLEKVSESAIAMALHRMGKNLRTPMFGLRFLKQLNDITVRSSLVEFVCPNAEELSELLETISKSARRRKDTFVNFSRGMHESLLIVDEESAKEVAAALGKHKNILRTDNLSAITLRLPESSLKVPGLYYPILKALASEGISFVEVMSVRTELSIIFEDKDVDRAFSVLKRITS